MNKYAIVFWQKLVKKIEFVRITVEMITLLKTPLKIYKCKLPSTTFYLVVRKEFYSFLKFELKF